MIDVVVEVSSVIVVVSDPPGYRGLVFLPLRLTIKLFLRFIPSVFLLVFICFFKFYVDAFLKIILGLTVLIFYSIKGGLGGTKDLI